jgi:formamidopyrimidine-DNA glycosylase
MRHINYFDCLVEYFSKHKISTLLDPQEIMDLSESIYEDLMLCAEARLLVQDSHSYFEKMLSVYHRQGHPCAWTGGNNWRSGDFVVYAT